MPRYPDARAAAWCAIATLGCGLVWLTAAQADRAERHLQIDLRCLEEGCLVAVDAGREMWLDAPRQSRGTGVGLYAYRPHEFRGRPLFRDLRVEPERGPRVAYDLLGPGGTPEAWREAPDWRSVPGRGFGPRLAAGDRSMLLLDGTYGNFRLTLDVVDALDVGIAFGARDGGSGTVVVVRPHYNDVLAFTMDAGRAGEALALAALRELDVWRELLRLAGLAARIAGPGFALAFLLLVYGRAPRLAGGSDVDAPMAGGRTPPGFVAVLATAALAAHAAIALYGFGGVPHIADESAYLFQARVFAAGELWAPPPGAPEFFLHEHVVLTPDRWFAKYPPLFPALLGLGVAAGMPWLVNPMLGALLALATFLLAREVCGGRWALLAAGLAATSPFVLVMNATMMSHTVAALLVTLALWWTIRAARFRALTAAALGGGCLGAAALARPYTALLAAAAVGGWLAACCLRAPDRRRMLAVTTVLVACALPFGAAWLGWNAVYTEGKAVSVHAAYAASDTLGFGPDRGNGWLKTWGTWGHTPAKGLRSVSQFLDYSSRDLLGWPLRLAPTLLVAGLALGLRPGNDRRWSGATFRELPDPAWLLFGTFALLVVGHTLYWATQHIAYGARYWFEAAPALIVLVTLSLRTLHARINPGAASDDAEAANGAAFGSPGAVRTNPAAAPRFNPLAALLVAGLVGFNLFGYLPGRLAELPRYGGIGAELKREVARRGLTDAVIFVQTQGLLYNDGFHMNDPLAWTYPIFARDLGPRNAELLRRHPGHPGFRWDGARLSRLPAPPTELVELGP